MFSVETRVPPKLNSPQGWRTTRAWHRSFSKHCALDVRVGGRTGGPMDLGDEFVGGAKLSFKPSPVDIWTVLELTNPTASDRGRVSQGHQLADGLRLPADLHSGSHWDLWVQKNIVLRFSLGQPRLSPESSGCWGEPSCCT